MGAARKSYDLLAAIGAATCMWVIGRSLVDRGKSTSGGSRAQNYKEIEKIDSLEIVFTVKRLGNILEEYKEQQHKSDRGKRCREIATIVGLFLTAFFTIVVAAAGIAQTWAFIQSEKAFVLPIEADFTVPLVDRQPFDMYVTFKNDGKSPATIKELKAAIAHGLRPKPLYGDALIISVPPIVAGGEQKRVLPFKQPWIQKTIDEVRTGALSFSFYGLLSYWDDYTFFSSRETQFCYVYVRTDANDGHRFDPCPQPEYTYTR